jgi:predicted DNA-binding transcriptional regulator AlpA
MAPSIDTVAPALPRLLTEAQVEEMIGFARGTLSKNRCLKRPHPAFIRVGSAAIRYRRAAVEQWLAEREINPARTQRRTRRA